jgi:4-hydroxy-2-oxoheptanedioate aldolase
MRQSKVLKKLRSGRFARVCGLGHYLPFFVRHAAHYRFDGIWLDLEHRAMGDREVQALLAACHASDIDCMVRPPTYERARLYRYLEDGAAGLMIPFVNDAAIARRLVESVKFPPVGERGLDGAGLDGRYYLDVLGGGETYCAEANRETFIVAQIETPEGVANVREIAAVPGIDLLFVGPADLGLRLSVAPGAGRMVLANAVETVRAAARENGKAWGIPAGSIEDLARYRELGAQMVPRGGDFWLMKVLDECSRELDSVLGD